MWGDVRLDICRTVASTIIADAQNVPFKQGAFKIAKMNHILEHLHNPSKALNECLYVVREEVIIVFPTETDMYPVLIRYLFSLPLSIRGILEWCRHRRTQVHKWIINPEAIVKFLNQQRWKCTVTKGSVPLLTTFQSKRTPKRLKRLNKYLLQITDSYVIEAEKVT